MKPIKVCPENAIAIEAALASVNGAWLAHGFNAYGEINTQCAIANRRIRALLGTDTNAPKRGATFEVTSGATVPNAYARKGFRRNATRIAISARATGWFLVLIEKCEIYQRGGSEQLWLTPEQGKRAVQRTRSQFSTVTLDDTPAKGQP